MKLLYTLTMYPPATGGAQLNQHLLAQQLQPQHSVQVVTQWDSNRTDWLLGSTLQAPTDSYNYHIDGVDVHRLGLSWWEKTSIAPFVLAYYPLMQHCIPSIAMCLERHLFPFAQEAELVHNVRIGREALSYASLNVARRRNIPFVLTPVHHPRWVGWRYRAYNKLYTLADALIALTNVERETLINLGVPEEKIFVTGVGPIVAPEPDPQGFLHDHKLGGPVILFLGQHYTYKGYQQVLQAAPLVWRRQPDAQFVFIGPPVDDSEHYFAMQQDPRIHRLGTVDVQTKTDALAACDLLCVPSTQESFGLVYTEAWTFAKPVIGCNIPAVAEVISDGIDGYVVAQDPAQIAERITYLLERSSHAQAMGRAGQRKVEERYTWQRVAERAEQAYAHALGATASTYLERNSVFLEHKQ